MGKILVVAEKPSVARDIAGVLGAKTKGDGCLVGEEYIVSWAIGHLITLANPEEYDPALKKWSKKTLPIIPEEIKLMPVARTKPQLNVLKKLMNSKDVDHIICATDSGREGELIFRYIYEYVKCSKKVYRLWISSMTNEAIKAGFDSLKPGEEYDNLYASAKCRSEADWLVGINASRAYTLKYDALLSIGRVQTPTLNILVNRHKEIEKFVPQDYWQIKADFGLYQGLWTDLEANENKIFEKEKADAICAAVEKSKGVITEINVERKNQPPGLLYDLTLLQRECNRRYSYSAKTTLQIAQDLYEKRKLITYPRTDSQYLTDDMRAKILGTIKSLPKKEYGEYIDYLTALEKLPMGKRIFNNAKVSDHHAIIPTGKYADMDKLSADERNVFDMVVRKFLAAFYPNYVYDVTKITTCAEGENFITQGNTVIDIGWKKLYPNDKGKDKDEENILPKVNENEEYDVCAVELQTKQTPPPKPYNEEHLLSAMENAGRFTDDEELKEQLKDSGIGTPATRAAIIERIIEVGYVQRKGKNLIPTEKGIKLTEIVPDELKSPETTGKWERGLTSIAKGKMQSQRFMGSINRFVKFIVDSAESGKAVEFEKEPKKEYKNKGSAKSFGKCPVCENGKILENTKAFYCDKWRDGCKTTIWKNTLKPYGIDLNGEMMANLLKNGKIEDVDMFLPQTKEKCKATVILDKEKDNIVQIINVNRLIT
ncbi:DNA topoisomerase III [Tyzzerella sp. OttesenSCG-928-J15]|nr:DNA topoisomerase III [Tyzzerella sp. OttesenSCG-928-J15]